MVIPVSENQETLDYANQILKEEHGIAFAATPLETSRLRVEKKFKFARQKSKLAGTIRGTYFVIKVEYALLK